MIKQFHTYTNLPFSRGNDEWKIYCKSYGTNVRLKSQPQLNTHNKGNVWKKISNQNTQGIRRNKSRIESKQNWKSCFSKNRASWLLFLISFSNFSFWTFLLDWIQTTYESTFVSVFGLVSVRWTKNKIAETMEKFRKSGKRRALECKKAWYHKRELKGWHKKKDKKRKGWRKLMEEEGLSCHLEKGGTPWVVNKLPLEVLTHSR